jgi:guanylate cyclase
VIGSRRLSYDLWGDSVNVAARMQSLAEPGTLLATGAVASVLGPSFTARPGGELPVKGRGMMETFVLNRVRPLST